MSGAGGSGITYVIVVEQAWRKSEKEKHFAVTDETRDPKWLLDLCNIYISIQEGEQDLLLFHPKIPSINNPS